MSNWSKLSQLDYSPMKDEVWIDNKNAKRYKVHVTYGKDVNIFDLKVHETYDYRAVVDRVKSTCEKIFSSKNLKKIGKCLVCGQKTSSTKKVFGVYGAVYIQCKYCSHVYLDKYVDERSLFKYYTTSKSYQKTYAEKKNSKIRVENVAKPKAQWAIDEFRRNFGRKPKSILDVGAGSGHFVRACRDLGLRADGIEISETGRQFSKDYFNIDLISSNFIYDWKKFLNYDMITFWGVVEHVIEPVKLLKTARLALEKHEGLVIAAVPHWSSFGTAVQSVFPKTIVRHLDPSGHISCFTDQSIATAYTNAGLNIVGAWYYGMDIYELTTQCSFSLKDKKIIKLINPKLNMLQASLDRATMSDEIALVGKVN